MVCTGHPACTTSLLSHHDTSFEGYCPAMSLYWVQSAVMPIYLVVHGYLLDQNHTCPTETSYGLAMPITS